MTTKREACEKWVQRDFSNIPYALLERAYLANEQVGEDIEILAPTPDDWAERYYTDYLDGYSEDFPTFEQWQDQNNDLYDWDDPEELDYGRQDYEDELLSHQKANEQAIEKAKEAAREDGWYENVGPLPMWGWVFVPNNGLDADWIEANAKEISELGFTVYQTEEIGVYLGINGAGYDFYDAHWLPLYDLRGLQWHDEG